MRHIVCTSGGKDSTALAIWMKRQRPEVPVEYAFCDTGRELPELYEYLNSLEGILGQPIKRLTGGWYCDFCDIYGSSPEPPRCPYCDQQTKPRDMDYYMKRKWRNDSGPYLPSAHSRWCTSYLKIRPLERYLRGSTATVYIAFRSDEDRVGNYGGKPNIRYEYPFQDAGIDLQGVMDILASAGLKLPDFYQWRGVGGCWNCPFQRKRHWLGLKRNHPELFARACEEESHSAFKYSGSKKSLPVLVAEAEEKERAGKLEDDDLGSACSICAK